MKPDFKFGVQVDHSKSQPTDDKLSLTGTWSCHMTKYSTKISLEWLKVETSNFVHWLDM